MISLSFSLVVYIDVCIHFEGMKLFLVVLIPAIYLSSDDDSWGCVREEWRGGKSFTVLLSFPHSHTSKQV